MSMNYPDANPAHLRYWADFANVPIDHDVIALLARASHQNVYTSGECLVSQADPAKHVYLVVEGRFKAVAYSENGHEIWLSDANPGDLVGEIAVLESTQRTSSVVADEASVAIGVSNQVFLEALKMSGEFSLSITRLLARRLFATSSQLTELVTIPVAARLHSELMRIGEPDPQDREVFWVRQVHSVSDLAERIHATREATSRAMSQLEKRGLVKRAASAWTVIFPSA